MDTPQRRLSSLSLQTRNWGEVELKDETAERYGRIELYV